LVEVDPGLITNILYIVVLIKLKINYLGAV